MVKHGQFISSHVAELDEKLARASHVVDQPIFYCQYLSSNALQRLVVVQVCL
jgi:hypothetical protein